ncbi:hypothetical protein [Streptomyces sp. F001]|uniref:hypothetical protein n=1 Tax=Streptomyces sp. F001 TaxID=1510026 RepID=UPI00101E765A|nr:hypothetical protein [Streptomyces sp. F001]
MKNLRLHCLHRSVASTAAAAVISLAAALTSASPAGAQEDQSSSRQTCHVAMEQKRSGLEQVMWAVLSPQANTVLQDYCSPQRQGQGDGQRQDQGDGQRQDQGDGRPQSDAARFLPASGDMTDGGQGDTDR